MSRQLSGQDKAPYPNPDRTLLPHAGLATRRQFLRDDELSPAMMRLGKPGACRVPGKQGAALGLAGDAAVDGHGGVIWLGCPADVGSAWAPAGQGYHARVDKVQAGEELLDR